MRKILVLGCFLLIATVAKKASAAGLPTDIEKCTIGDGNCLLDRINQVFEKYPHGNAELSVPDLNPLKVDTLDVSQDSSKSVNLNLKMTDVKFVDFHTIRFFNQTGFDATDWNNTIVNYSASCPVMNIKSKYTIKGKILVLPIEGNGDMILIMDKPKFSMKLKMTTRKREDGKTYVTINKMKLKSEAEKMSIQMNNLFNGDKALGDNLNKVMNENWKIIWDEVEPSTDRGIAEAMKNGMNIFFDTHPLEDIFNYPK